MNAKKLPNQVTFLDCLKTFAVIIMLIDHIGLYFFDGYDWFRAIGRVGMPIWFFMAGYANSRDIPNKLWIGAFVLFAFDLMLFNKILALNALVTIILIRFFIDRLMPVMMQSRYLLFLLSVVMMLLYLPTNMVFEYGTHAFLFAVMGYFVRHKADILKNSFVTSKDLYAFMIFVWVGFCIMQNAVFGFTDIQFLMMAIVSAGVMVVLSQLQPRNIPQITVKPLKIILQFCGRKTLEIYVVHLIAFKVVLFAFLALK